MRCTCHPPFATVLACLADSTMPPINQNSAQFFNRVAIDDAYGGLAFEEEGERCAELLSDPAAAQPPKIINRQAADALAVYPLRL